MEEKQTFLDNYWQLVLLLFTSASTNCCRGKKKIVTWKYGLTASEFAVRWYKPYCCSCFCYFLLFFLLVSMIMSLLSTFRVPMYTEICTQRKIFLKSSHAKWCLVWIIPRSRKGRIIDKIFVESQISCRYPFSVSLYFLIFLFISK